MGDTDVVALRQVVQKLSLTQRRVLVLHYAEDLTVSEISLVLDLPEARVVGVIGGLRELARRLLPCELAPRQVNHALSTPA